ncbi:MAG: DUF4943 domain-containing protein [Runella slithyformis]|nr:MAG: DUF4943 domain-containing protein [Runella slithyformis]
MKTLKLFLVLISFTALISCKKSESEVKTKLSVERYIELLKANQYDLSYLPAFTYQDIPALLKYRNETQIITNFSHNGISSLYAPNCTLGMYVLWTIESIRAVAIQSKYLIMGFPSQNPILALRVADELSLIYSAESHQIAAKAYFDWWENNKQKNFNEFKNIDPLKSTDYRWH